MAALRLVAAIVAMLVSAPACAQPAGRWQREVAEASGRFGIPEEWINRVIEAESGGRTRLLGRPVVSRAGAMGLMQLMPATWSEVSSALGLGPDPHDPRDNILAGTFYLRSMYDRFGYPGLFSAYNAGPARYAEHLATGRRLPAETVAYSAALSGERLPRRAPARPKLAPGLFTPALAVARNGAARARSAGAIFVPLNTSGPAASRHPGGD